MKWDSRAWKGQFYPQCASSPLIFVACASLLSSFRWPLVIAPPCWSPTATERRKGLQRWEHMMLRKLLATMENDGRTNFASWLAVVEGTCWLSLMRKTKRVREGKEGEEGERIEISTTIERACVIVFCFCKF